MAKGIKTRNPPTRKADPLIVVGGLLVILFFGVAVLGPYLVPYPPLRQDITQSRQGPSQNHWFGTDELGRDLFSRVVVGARITLMVSLSTLLVAAIFGLVLGVVSGYFGGGIDIVLMRLIDIQLAIPGLVLALLLISLIGSGLNSLVLVMVLFSYPSFARLTRGLALRSKSEGYVEAAVSIGASHRRIIIRHVLPNVLPHVMGLVTVSLGRVVLTTSGLGFLGFGVEPGLPEWGMMIAQGRSLFRTHPHVVLFPGLAILLTVLGFNLLGDGLRDLIDPRLRGN